MRIIQRKKGCNNFPPKKNYKKKTSRCRETYPKKKSKARNHLKNKRALTKKKIRNEI